MSVPLRVSLLMNLINISGNALFIYGFHWGVAGAGLSTLISRTVSGLTILLLLRNPANPICLRGISQVKWDHTLFHRILRISIPNGIESGIFQFGKLLVASLISSLGTVAIAANAVISNLSGINTLPGSAISVGIITVMGQCVGAGNYQKARNYTKTLLLTAHLCVAAIGAGLYFLMPWLAARYGISPEARALTVQVGRLNCILCALLWPSSFTLPAALRGAGDVKYVLIVSLSSMFVFRIGLSYVFCRVFSAGLLGVWAAMYADWIVRACAFWIRFRGKRWENIRII